MGRFVLMGVSGCGKTSVGEALAARGLTRFIDGDTLHPPGNIAKMASGQPLDDDDRAPWLADVGAALGAGAPPVTIGCSSLKRRYRDWIRAAVGGSTVHFLHLAAPKAVLERRVNTREGHFMPPALLDSQFATLQPLQPDEAGQVIDIDRPVEAVIDDAAAYIARNS
ncbi:MAG: gluconokinase [Pseudomonadota bacterium]